MTQVADNFNRPNGPLGSRWGAVIINAAETMANSLSGGIQIKGNAFGPIDSGGGDACALWSGQSFGNDQWAQAQVASVADPTAVLAITAATFAAGNVTYTYTVVKGSVAAAISGGALYVIISGMTNAGNNGNFTATTFGVGTFTVANASGVTESGSSGSGLCPSDSGAGVMVRASGTSASNLNCYMFHVGTNSFGGDGRSGYYELWRVVNGAGTLLKGQTFNLPPQVGDVIALAVVGTTVTAYVNGIVYFSVTDIFIASGVPGIWAWSMNGAQEYKFANWTTVVNPPGNSGTSYTNFQAGDTPFVIGVTRAQKAIENFLESGVLNQQDLVPYANGDLHTLNANWMYQGSSSFKVTAGVVYDSNAGLNFAYRSDVVPGNDQFAEVVCRITAGAAIQNGGPAVRVSSSAATGYLLQIANDILRLTKYIAGVATPLGDALVLPTVTGDVVRLEVRGTTLNVYRNGILVLGPITDTSILSGNVGIFSAGNTTANGFTAWAGGSANAIGSLTNFSTVGRILINPSNGAFSSENFSQIFENSLVWSELEYAQATGSALSATSLSGPAIRLDAVGRGYFFGPSGNSVYIGRHDVNGGVLTGVLLASVVHTFSRNDVFRLEGRNGILIGYINDVQVLVAQDNMYVSGKPGIVFSSTPGTTGGEGLVTPVNSFNNWSSGILNLPTFPVLQTDAPGGMVNLEWTRASSKSVAPAVITPRQVTTIYVPKRSGNIFGR